MSYKHAESLPGEGSYNRVRFKTVSGVVVAAPSLSEQPMDVY